VDNTPKGNRLHIALMGRTNVGKSSLLNLMLGQDIAITSPVAGTTTDVVEKQWNYCRWVPCCFWIPPALMMFRNSPARG